MLSLSLNLNITMKPVNWNKYQITNFSVSKQHTCLERWWSSITDRFITALSQFSHLKLTERWSGDRFSHRSNIENLVKDAKINRFNIPLK